MKRSDKHKPNTTTTNWIFASITKSHRQSYTRMESRTSDGTGTTSKPLYVHLPGFCVDLKARPENVKPINRTIDDRSSHRSPPNRIESNPRSPNSFLDARGFQLSRVRLDHRSRRVSITTFADPTCPVLTAGWRSVAASPSSTVSAERWLSLTGSHGNANLIVPNGSCFVSSCSATFRAACRWTSRVRWISLVPGIDLYDDDD